MAKSKASKEESEDVEISSKDALGSLLKLTKGDHYNDVVAKNLPISTGSLLLDSQIKIRSGSVIRLCGAGAELGKTSEAFVLAQNFMNVMPKSKTIYIKAESRLSPEMQKRSGHKFVSNSEDWEYGTVFVWSVNFFETIASTLESLLKTMHDAGEYLCIIWDSLDGTILKSDSQKDVWGNESAKVAGVPLLTKLLFKRFALPLSHYDALMIITSQYSAAIKIDPYAKDVPRQIEGSGGSSIGHQSDYVLYYHPRYNGDFILEKPDEKPDLVKNKVLGVFSTVEIRKSATDVTGVKLKIPILKGRIGCAIWVEKEVVDMAIQYGQLTRKGAWFSFSQSLIEEAKLDEIEIKEQHQGINGVFDYINNDKAVFNWLYLKFKKMIDV
jgi:hypothetical protein